MDEKRTILLWALLPFKLQRTQDFWSAPLLILWWICCGVFSLDIFKSHLDMVTGNVLQVALPKPGALDLTSSRSPFPPQAVRDSGHLWASVLSAAACGLGHCASMSYCLPESQEEVGFSCNFLFLHSCFGSTCRSGFTSRLLQKHSYAETRASVKPKSDLWYKVHCSYKMMAPYLLYRRCRKENGKERAACQRGLRAPWDSGDRWKKKKENSTKLLTFSPVCCCFSDAAVSPFNALY